MPPSLRLRPVVEADLPFLRRVYASTREEELARTGWGAEEMQAFLDQQFDAQHRHYHEHCPDAAFDVVLADEDPVGRLYVDRREDELRIVDIALLPEHRGRGIGGRLLAGLLAEADASRMPVRIHVERENRALGLYRRLGFAVVVDTGVYYLMERAPGA